MRDHQFGNNDEILCFVEEFLEDRDTIFLRGGIAVHKQVAPSALISRCEGELY